MTKSSRPAPSPINKTGAFSGDSLSHPGWTKQNGLYVYESDATAPDVDRAEFAVKVEGFKSAGNSGGVNCVEGSPRLRKRKSLRGVSHE